MKLINIRPQIDPGTSRTPLDWLDDILYLLEYPKSDFPYPDIRLSADEGRGFRELLQARSVVRFSYERPFYCYGEHRAEGEHAIITFFRCNLPTREIEQLGAVHHPPQEEIRGVWMHDEFVLYSASWEGTDPKLQDEARLWLFDAREGQQYPVPDDLLAKSISDPMILQREGETYIVLNPNFMCDYESEDIWHLHLPPEQLNYQTIESLQLMPFSQFIADVKAGRPLQTEVLEYKEHDGFVRVTHEDEKWLYYVRKDFHTMREELILLDRNTFERRELTPPTEYQHLRLHTLNGRLYLVSPEEDLFYDLIDDVAHRIEHSYFNHVQGLADSWVMYFDEELLFVECWARQGDNEIGYYAIANKRTGELVRVEGEYGEVAVAQFQKTFIIY